MAPTRPHSLLPVVLVVLLLAHGAPTPALAQLVPVLCTNSLADAASLNTAIAASPPGARVQIAGTCLLNATVVLAGGRDYVGTSRTGTVLRQANGSHLAALVASDQWVRNTGWTGAPVRVAHLTLDGNRAANANTSALVLRSWLTVVEDVLVSNAPEDGIRVSNVAADGATMLSTSQVNGVIQNVFVENSGAHGVHVKDAGNAVTDWSLLNSWISTSGGSGVYLENGAGWQVKNNHIYGVGDHAIWAHFCFGSTLSDNYVEDFGGNGAAGSSTGQDAFYGVACVMQNGAASVISGNKVHQLRAGRRDGPPAYNYIAALFGRDTSFAQVSVVGNTVRGDNGTTGVGLAFIDGRSGGGEDGDADPPARARVAVGLGGAGGADGTTAAVPCCDFRVVSSANQVQLVPQPRRVDPGVTLEPGL